MAIVEQTLTFYAVRCNLCGNQTRSIAEGYSSEEIAVNEAIAKGWWVITKGEAALTSEHFCPRCW